VLGEDLKTHHKP